MRRSIVYSDVVNAAGKVAHVMVPGRYDMDTKGGQTAAVRLDKSTGKYQISLPSYPALARLPRAEADYMLGLLVHELAHVRFTSFKFPADRTQALHDLTNALEDCRIERNVIQSKAPPNGGKLLSDVCETLAMRAAAKRFAWDKHPREAALTWAVCVLGRLEFRGYDALPSTVAFSKTVPTWARDLIARFMAEIMDTQSTDQCWGLARRMLAAIPPKPKKPEEPTKPTDEPQDGDPERSEEGTQGDEPEDGDQGDQEPQDGEEGEKGTDTPTEPSERPGEPSPDDGEASDKEGDDGEASEEGDDGDKAGDGDDGDGEADDQDQDRETESTKGGQGGTDQDAPDFDPASVLKEIAKALKLPVSVQRSGTVDLLATLDRCKHQVDTRSARAHSNAEQAKRLRAMANTAGLAPKVRQMLHSMDDSMTTRFETRGRLDRKAIARSLTGDPRVFTKRSPSDGIRTGVGFLFDMSSSMGDVSNGMARYTAQGIAGIALAEACARASADVAMWGFGPNATGSYGSDDFFAGVLIPFKDWNESIDVGAARLAGHGSVYGTNLCPSLIAAAQAMAARPGLDKRILLVMTDGDCRMGRPMLRETAAFAAGKYGITIVGVGIQVDVDDAFPLAASVKDIRDLPTVTMRALIKAVG